MNVSTAARRPWECARCGAELTATELAAPWSTARRLCATCAALPVELERGTPEYLARVEAALCLSFTTLALVAAGPLGMVDAVDPAEVANSSVLIVNDLAPLVGAILTHWGGDGRMGAELQRLDAAGLGDVAEAMKARLDTLKLERGIQP